MEPFFLIKKRKKALESNGEVFCKASKQNVSLWRKLKLCVYAKNHLHGNNSSSRFKLRFKDS